MKTFLIASLALATLFLSPGLGAEAKKVTYTYKRVGELEIKADVYGFDDDRPRPVLVWIHGGALINGHRESVPGFLQNACQESGIVVVSIDYRLAPETQLPEIIQDVEDSFTWIREKGPELFHADHAKIAAAGGSAGGYLTLTAGYRVKPRLAALVSFWGYGDLVGSWYSDPSPHERHHQSKLSREEAFKQVAGKPISDSRDRKGDGGAFYQFCRQTGAWPKAVSGWDPKKEPEKFFPYMAVKNVAADYPPTLLIHGDKDTDVPYEQSVMMVTELKKHGVEHRLITLARGEHGLQGADRKAIDEANAAAIAFVRKHLGAK